MPLDLYPGARNELSDYVATQPAYGPAPDFGQSFQTSINAAASSFRVLRALRNSQNVVNDWLDAFEGQTGYRPEAFSGQLPGSFDYAALAKAYETERTARPGFDLTPPPTQEQAWQKALDTEREIATADAKMRARPQTIFSQAGSALGGIASFAIDPITILSSGFVGPEAAGILATALREGVLFGAQQGAISTENYPISKALNPDYSPLDVLGEAGAAAAGGAVLGAGVRGLANVAMRLRYGNYPRYVQDAANVVQREALNTTGNPNEGRAGGAGDKASFAANSRAAEAAVAAGKPVEPTPDLFANGTYRPSRVFTSDGKAVDVQYQVVDANELVTSHGPDLSVNPAFPPEFQPRDRTRVTSADQINAIASRLEPERLGPSADASTGAPIIGPDGVVESGNGRVLAILRAYEADGQQAAAYRSFLAKQGFNTDGIANPVLVARRVTQLAPDERAAFTTAANRAVAMRMSAPEQAAADARLLDEATLSKLVEGKGIDTADNRPFVRSFVGQLPKEERGGLVDRAGVLSQEGQGRVQAALLARAYGDPALLSRLLESSEPGVKGIGGALTDAAASWATMRANVSRGIIPAGMDLTPDLLSAFRLVEKARASGTKIGDVLAQQDWTQPITPATKALLGLMFNEDMTRAVSRTKVAAGLRAYAEEAVKNTTDARLFGDALRPEDVMATALQKAGREDLAAAAEAAVTPEAVAKTLAEPVTDDAAVHEVEHLLAERGEGMPVGGGHPPKSGLVVANIGSDGKIYYGKPGQVHFQLSELYPHGERGDWQGLGFAGPDGKFLTREQALEVANAAGPQPIRAPSNMRGELDAMDVREQRPGWTQEGSPPARAVEPLMIPDPLGTLNPDGSPVMRPVRELLDEADAEIAAAKEIEACASGAMPMAAAAAAPAV